VIGRGIHSIPPWVKTSWGLDPWLPNIALRGAHHHHATRLPIDAHSAATLAHSLPAAAAAAPGLNGSSAGSRPQLRYAPPTAWRRPAGTRPNSPVSPSPRPLPLGFAPRGGGLLSVPPSNPVCISCGDGFVCLLPGLEGD
jgi:hypothetical protein